MASSGDLHGGGQEEYGYENPYRQMILDVAESNFDQGEEEPNLTMEENPNSKSQKFYDLLQSADAELYPGSSMFQLEVVSRMLNIKMENTLSQRGYNQMMQLLKDALPKNNNMLDSYYQTKKLVRSLGLPVEKIDCCESGCMLYWDDDKHLTSCKFCGHERYKRRVGSRKRKLISYKKMYYFRLIPRLRRLYASYATAADMRWHHEHIQEDGVMHHPSDSEAWKHFNETHLFFAAEPRNAVEKGRDPTPSEIHLHVHTHGHDGKSFIGNRSRIVHETYEEILKNQTQTQSDIHQYQAYYQAAGGEKKKRIYGLGSQVKCYYGSKFGNTSSFDAPPSTVPSNAQSTVIENMNELVAQLIPALTKHILPALTEKMLPGLVERVSELISPTSHQPSTFTRPLNVPPIVPAAPATAGINEVHASSSDNDCNSPTSH